MKKNWQTKTLIFFLIIFIVANIESFILKIIEFIVRLPLNINSMMINFLGKDSWSRLIATTSSPTFLILLGLFLCVTCIGATRSFEKIKKSK